MRNKIFEKKYCDLLKKVSGEKSFTAFEYNVCVFVIVCETIFDEEKFNENNFWMIYEPLKN